MKKTRKFLAFALCALMIVSVLPMGAFAADVAESTEKDGYLWDFESFEAGTKLKASDFAGKFDGITWGGDGTNAVVSNWETMVDPEDEDNIVLNPLFTRGSYLVNGINFKSNGNMDGHIVEFSYDIYMTARGAAGNDVPFLRLYYTQGGSSKNQTLVSLDAGTAVLPGTATTETSMDFIQLGDKNYGTDKVTKTELFALRWYNIRMLVDTTSGIVACYLDGNLVGIVGISGWDPETCKVNYLIGLRCYDTTHTVSAYVDDIYVGYDPSFVPATDKRDFTDVSDFSFAGFKMDNTFKDTTTWSVGSADGDTYMVHANGTAEPLTWLDSLNLMDRGEFSVSFDYRYDSKKSGGGLLGVKLDRASGGDNQEFRIIHQNEDILTFGPTTNTAAGLNIGRITTPSSNGGAKWHTIKTVFKPYITEDYIDMLYEFYIDGALSAYTDIIEGVDDDGNTTRSYNFYTKYSGTWTAKNDLQTAKVVQYIKSGDENGNGVADEGETIVYGSQWVATGCSWGNDTNNCHRLPMGYWDGYYKQFIDGVGTDGIQESDGKIATIKSLYMFHFNSHGFSVDNIEVELPKSPDPIETVEMLGYQLGNDKQSVRFVAGVDSLDYGQIGVDVDVFEQLSETGWVDKTNNRKSNNVFMALTADGEQVVAREHYGSRFFTMFSVYDIDSSAVVCLTPYVTRAGVKNYGTPAYYAVAYDAVAGVSVTVLSSYVNDFSDGVTGTGDGYSRSTYAQLIAPNADWGSGGEGGARVVSAEDGAMKISVPKLYYYDSRTTDEELMKKWYYTYTAESVDEETGEPVTTLQYVRDANGNAVAQRGSMSSRYKIAYVIPHDYTELVGKTLIISAKIKVAEVSKQVQNDVVGYTGEVAEENAATYQTPVAQVDADAKATISFGFFEDVLFSFKGTVEAGNVREYQLGASDEWVEVYATIEITDKLIAGISKKKDSNNVEQPIPLRPTFQLGGAEGWASVMYVDDVTCVVAPTIAE